MIAKLSHFNKGTLKVAFVFSAPGSVEKVEGRPVSGVTGKNLDIALETLHKKRPDLFPSTDRYDYRITNAFAKPLSKKDGDDRTEARKSQVLHADNIDRVVRDLKGCDTVILCGKRAQLLGSRLDGAKCRIALASHTSVRALVATHPLDTVSKTWLPSERNATRAQLWAKAVLEQL